MALEYRINSLAWDQQVLVEPLVLHSMPFAVHTCAR